MYECCQYACISSNRGGCLKAKLIQTVFMAMLHPFRIQTEFESCGETSSIELVKAAKFFSFENANASKNFSIRRDARRAAETRCDVRRSLS